MLLYVSLSKQHTYVRTYVRMYVGVFLIQDKFVGSVHSIQARLYSSEQHNNKVPSIPSNTRVITEMSSLSGQVFMVQL